MQHEECFQLQKCTDTLVKALHSPISARFGSDFLQMANQNESNFFVFDKQLELDFEDIVVLLLLLLETPIANVHHFSGVNIFRVIDFVAKPWSHAELDDHANTVDNENKETINKDQSQLIKRILRVFSS